MGFYLLPIAELFLALVLAATLAVAVVRAVRRTSALAHFSARCDREVPAGGEVSVHARIVPRGGRAAAAEARLVCTMFDHRAHPLYEQSIVMEPAGEHDYRATVGIPRCALGSGVVGDDLSTLFSEDAHRLLVSWAVHVAVRAGGEDGAVVARRVLPLQVRSAQPLSAEPAALDRVVADAFGEVKDELLFNWLVKAAARDGVVAERERELLRDVLRTQGVPDAPAADARIDAELEREVGFAGALLRRHAPPATRLAFCRLLYAVAWRDGGMDAREEAFLAQKLGELGLTRAEARQVEREVLIDLAQRALA